MTRAATVGIGLTAVVTAAWMAFHLPATHGAEWIIDRVGFASYEAGIRLSTVLMAVLTYGLVVTRERRRSSGVTAMAIVLLAFVAVAEWRLIIAPIEYIHLPQYALIAYLLGRARLGGEAAWLGATAAGALDEGYQLYFLRSGRPDYFDWNDVVLNGIGGAYGLVLLFAGSEISRARTIPWRLWTAGLATAAIVSVIVLPPSFSPYLTPTPRGAMFRILSAIEAIALLGALWWTLRRLVLSVPPPMRRPPPAPARPASPATAPTA